jgi:NADP-dependent 3-hydroxy acid dehydrogenase YdfG
LKENQWEQKKQKDLQDVLSNEAGRRVIGGIFHECGFWKAIFCGEAAAAQAFNEGLRSVAVGLANRIRKIDPMLIARCEMDYQQAKHEAASHREDEE